MQAVGKVYKLTVDGSDVVYFGSTTRTLVERLSNHLDCTSRLLFELGEKVDIILLEVCPIDKMIERERFYIENFSCVNTTVPGRTQKEYYEQKRGGILAQKKHYHAEHRDKNLQRMKAYREKNKEQLNTNRKTVIECGDCGSRFMQSNKSNHLKSKRHQNAISSTPFDTTAIASKCTYVD